MAKREIKNPAEGLFNTGEPKREPYFSNIEDFVAEIKSIYPEMYAHEQVEPEVALVTAPPSKETRTQRKQFVLPPSLCREAERKCRILGISLNEAVNQLLTTWVNGG